MNNTAGQHFVAVKDHIEATMHFEIPDENNLEWTRKDAGLLNSDRAKRALKKTASMYLGAQSKMEFHSWTDPAQVAGHLIHIAHQRHADLNGAKKLCDVLAHVYATYGMAYAFSNEPMEFEAVAVLVNNGMYLAERVAILV